MLENNEKYVLTISVAAYNREKDISYGLDSIAGCTELDKIEVLIIDDGSTDDTSVIARQYENKYPGSFKVITKENGGWGSTVNCGLDKAKGKYFKVLDADDSMATESLALFVQQLEGLESDLVCTGFFERMIKTDKQKEYYKSIPDVVLGQTYSIETVVDKIPMHIHSLAFRTDALRDKCVQLLEKSFYVDKELIVKSIIASSTVSFLNLSVYIYNKEVDGQSLSAAGLNKHIDENSNICLSIAGIVEKQHDSNVKACLREYVLNCIKWHYIFLVSIDANDQHRKSLLTFNRRLKDECGYYYRNRSVARSFIVFERLRFFPYHFMMKYYHKRLGIG